MKSVFLWGGVGIAVAAGIFLVLSFASSPSVDEANLGRDYSREMSSEGAAHVAEGREVPYQSNPPTSGSHWSDPLLDGLYDTEKPDEAIVHSLEHGRIWISYQLGTPESAVERLKEIASSEVRVILTPREANDSAIALAAWKRLDTFELGEDGGVDEQRIRDFIVRYRDKGPEYVPQMTGKRYE